MEKIKNEFENLNKLIKNYGLIMSKIQEYPGNSHYKFKKKGLFIEINNSLKKIKRLLSNENSINFNEVESEIFKLIDEKNDVREKQKILENIELKWQDLRLDLENIHVVNETHKISSEIPNTDVRLDLEEAIKDYQNGCFLSSIVMCRRAYEGALISKYKQVEKKDPLKNIICKSCKNILKSNAFFGIVELHNWAIGKKVIPDKFKDIGFLVPNLGAAGAHPTELFPRDSEVTNIVIATTLALVKRVYSN